MEPYYGSVPAYIRYRQAGSCISANICQAHLKKAEKSKIRIGGVNSRPSKVGYFVGFCTQPVWTLFCWILHTAGLDTIFVQIYMDALPGVPGVSKNQIFFYK
jgi:hypothetical protein